MELRAAGLKAEPFRTAGGPAVFCAYGGQEKAFEFFDRVMIHNSGLGLFQGPHDSGKSTIIREYTAARGEDFAIATVNCYGMNASAFLEAVLRGFGYMHKFDTVNELMNMVSVFAKHQTAADAPPLLFVENAHIMNPSTMRTLCDLAKVRVREKFALKIILVSDRSINYIADAPAMEGISRRLMGNFHLEPLTIDETSDYLYMKMRYGGCVDPDYVFPDAVCDELYRASGGWPGVVDRLAALAIENAPECPISLEFIEHEPALRSTRPTSVSEPAVELNSRKSGPVLYLTREGETLKKVRMKGARLLLGRSEHNDMQIPSKFVSRHHALLVRHGHSTLLMDLNSANGTYVNSRRVSNQLLINEDIITVGDFGLKFVDPNSGRHESVQSINFDETVVMMTMEDMRKVLARENTSLLPVAVNGSGKDDQGSQAAADSA